MNRVRRTLKTSPFRNQLAIEKINTQKNDIIMIDKMDKSVSPVDVKVP